jgi:hypothetical protein
MFKELLDLNVWFFFPLFQDDLEDLIANWDESRSIGDIFLKYVSVYCRVHIYLSGISLRTDREGNVKMPFPMVLKSARIVHDF